MIMNPKKHFEANQPPLSFPPKKIPIYDSTIDPVPVDVTGSYTGNPVDCTEPEQDADDL